MAVDFNYSVMFFFERNFEEDHFLKWMTDNWTNCFAYAGCYVFLVFAGRAYMENRPKFDLRIPLVLWSGVLGIFSIAGMVRTAPELVHMIYHHGVEHSICNPSYFYGPTAFWAFMFTVSKVYELGDTGFIVLRKQPLIFLHWYHHISVLIYVWYSYTDHTAPGRWFMVMNYTVHSFMYTYYALRALRIPVPKWVAMCITTMQISQMFFGIAINIISYRVKTRGDFCQQSYENLRYSFMMYFSYFCLFAYFFYAAYLRSKPSGVSVLAQLKHRYANGQTANGIQKKVK